MPTAYGTGTLNSPGSPSYTDYTLGSVRKMLVDRSGRFDLVTDAEAGDYTDNGANAIINAAQRWLDRMLRYPKDLHWYYYQLASGACEVEFKRPRIIREVWIADTTDGRRKLEYKTLDWIRENYYDVPLSSLDTGTPAYWTQSVLGLAPELADYDAAAVTAAGWTDTDYLKLGDHNPYGGIILMPPSDAAMTVEILGSWYSYELSDDADVSVWTYHPEILVRAARWQIEVDMHRNSQGRRDFEDALMIDLDQLRNDLVADEVAGPPEQFVMAG